LIDKVDVKLLNWKTKFLDRHWVDYCGKLCDIFNFNALHNILSNQQIGNKVD